jgi:hypothetical protein
VSLHGDHKMGRWGGRAHCVIGEASWQAHSARVCVWHLCVHVQVPYRQAPTTRCWLEWAAATWLALGRGQARSSSQLLHASSSSSSSSSSLAVARGPL